MSARLTADQRRLLDRLLEEEAGQAGRPERAGQPGRAALVPGAADRTRSELSFAQQRIWFFDRVRPGSSLYTISGAAQLRGALDTRVLRRALDEVLRRHESLRTTFPGEHEPWARVEEAGPVDLRETDLSGLPEERRSAAVREHLAAEAARPFDLARDRMLRCALLRLAPDEHLLQLSMHHIAADGWSLGVLIGELGTLYEAFQQGRPSPLPDLGVQYADFARWQRQLTREPRHTELLEKWTDRLAGAAPLDLVTDRPRRTEESYAGGWADLELPPELVARIKRFADRERATPFMVLSAAFAALLARWAGRAEDVLLGCAVAGRDRTEIEPLIGFFVNTLPLRLDLSGNPSLRTLVGRAREACTDLYAWQEVPFERIVQALRPERDPGARVPLVRHMLVLHNTPRPRLHLPGLEVAVLPVQTGTAKFELEIELAPTPDGGLTGWIEYARELFDESTVTRLAHGLRLLLADGVDRPDTPVRDLNVLGDEDRDLVTRYACGTPAYDVAGQSLPGLFERTADERASAPAVVHDGEVVSYAELDRRANRVAHGLRARGVGPEDVVGIAVPRSADAIAAMLGVLKAGAAWLPLDPALPPRRLARLAADAAVHAVLADTGTTARRLLAAAREEGQPTAPPVLSLTDEEIRLAPETRPGVTVLPGNGAYVLYTSGSTGRPKGAVNEHAAVVNRIRWMQDRYRLEPGEAVLHKTPLGFDVSVWEWLWPLAVGARVVVADGDGRRDPAVLAGLIREHAVTTCHFVPSMLRIFLDDPAAAGCAGPLRRIVCSGEALPPGLAARVQEVLPGVALHNLYGPTEAAIDVTAWTVPEGLDPEAWARLPIGTPIAGARTYVLDERLRPVPPGLPGELFLGGLPVGRGYRGRPALTADRFPPDPFEPGRRLYRTGDRARWLPDGTLDFLGRLDSQLKIRGQRIEPGEIETVLGAHPAVERAAVEPYRDAAGDLQLAAYVGLRARAAGPREEPSGEHAAHVDRWRTVFDATYRDSRPEDPTFDTVGWVDSATGDPIPDTEMRAWVEETVARIGALRPRRVLEIGCGTGLLLFRIAPDCALYHGTDVSAEVIERLRPHTERFAGTHVQLSRRAADDFSGLPAGGFDTVVLNSVVQYFPDAEYLVRVVRGALSLLAPGGHLFLGDVRNLLLLDALHTSLLLHRLPPDTPVPALRRLVARQAAREEELLVHPALFEAVAGTDADVTVLAKTSPYRNELTRFRYDVVLTARPPGAPPAPATDWRPWPGPAALPGAGEPRPFGWRAVPDARLAADLHAVRALRAAGDDQTVDDLRRTLATGPDTPAADPAALAEHTRTTGRTMTPRLGAEPGTLDLEFSAPAATPAASASVSVAPVPGPPASAPAPAATAASGAAVPASGSPVSASAPAVSASSPAASASAPAGSAPTPAGSAAPAPPPTPRGDTGGWAAYTNDPQRAARERLLVAGLREHLARTLPDFMVPASLVVLEEWPLGRTGKLDRAALPAPDGLRPTLATGFVAPRTATERAVARVWCEVLGVDRIGVHDDFFALGGHSLLAVQLVGRLRALPGGELSVGALLRAPTVAAVADLLDRAADTAAKPVPIQRAARHLIGEHEAEEGR
ncbi:amino acid adenylation domain-containing protein [Streptomyces sp. Go40/10]|uniref:non-ribosomal peptide synthetase n=1 Tax=Streptomyces sp. Go40/10 TaxID=2825844 RepID=UPI001E65C99B|nr:non-ribosomal peptide synthetase [Streptomyces sp. Go40/10]UFR00355.1 amino acid adenylation domain-containing protein [Streptomyces sp. Go40/10]